MHWQGKSCRSHLFAVSHISTASRRLIAAGFSQATCAPAFSAAIVHCLWNTFGVQTATKSGETSSSIFCGSV